MTLRLYFHPFSSYCQVVLTALYERDVPFEAQHVDLGDAAQRAALEALWPMVKFPVLRDEAADVTLAEASLIVEYLDRFGQAPPLVPADRDEALRVRLWDRVFDLYVDQQLQKVVGDRLRPQEARDPFGVEEAKARIRRAYAMADAELAQTGGPSMAGDAFTLADCAAAPALFYANIVAPLAGHRHLEGYFERLLARPSFARAVQEARPWRPLFPLGWPEGYPDRQPQ
ncbi:MAG TPA: glutathione S-transferase family protein [Allosphingosinicella sp.]|jgi:glutathione S-transferase